MCCRQCQRENRTQKTESEILLRQDRQGTSEIRHWRRVRETNNQIRKMKTGRDY